MIRREEHQQERQAYTLIELLVVMAIIAVLVSLISAAVMAVRKTQLRMSNQADITKMGESLEAAKVAYGKQAGSQPQFLPSRLLLWNNLSVYMTLKDPATGNPLVTPVRELTIHSRAVLTSMFGRNLFNPNSVYITGKISPPTPDKFASWAGATPNGSVLLEGQECLVFYLGGMPSAVGGTNVCTGFSKDPFNPSLPKATATEDRIGPFFDFKSSRLVPGPSNLLFVYLDPYSDPPVGNPYAYFAPVAENRYDLFSAATMLNKSDCASLLDPTGVSIQPYFEAGSTPTRFVAPKTFQIISAGENKAFGPGGAWDPATGTNNKAAQDDVANFSRLPLGGGQS